ncbi:2-oxoglutarate dehydrogenase E1 component [Melghirimyces thermohalophilus]|uniref:2-oxoglutarate dehydrogenase E1 component n=1 Tax=Melghirimyces thermohalophilus TaxID=1236220 RepID=A0A1G6MVK8_9BACL|nr:2-oxoglutarate dehydrogenase E1 component [Melghirimyces thermohalophilus]SDC59593.1 2-oxoglutarate dehydrogenase E1 component [Melghirimyces thermohalophilus]
MSTGKPGMGTPWQGVHGHNLAYLLDEYDRYRQDPEAVEPELKELFDQWGPPPASLEQGELAAGGAVQQPSASSSAGYDLKKVVAAEKLAHKIRTYGHLDARIDPLGVHGSSPSPILDPAHYGLSDEDLNAIPAHVMWAEESDEIQTGLDVYKRLRQIYTQSLAFEFTHVHSQDERRWLFHMVESKEFLPSLSKEKRLSVLNRLVEVDGFEKFLHKTFVGQKRFSIEGVDMLVPMLDEAVQQSIHSGVKNVMIGMAHRGRLNVLAHVLGKPYEAIFSEFHHAPNKELVPSEGSMGLNYGWTGDVKYHLGMDRKVDESDTLHTRLTLANNPSHLEFVNPVVEGYTRAAQDNRNQPGYPEQDVTKALSVLIHGDAAFPGEGIVAETLNMSRLRGYNTGGTIHIIANNQLGFTTEHLDSRSTTYSSDLAKGFEIPVVHVNADDPEACLAAIHLAFEYRARFHKDFLIDLIGYRRFGHNEMDDPSATQPKMYAQIHKHPPVRKLYAEQLKKEGIVSDDQLKAFDKKLQDRLKKAYKKVKENRDTEENVEDRMQFEKVPGPLPEVQTGVPLASLHEINENLLKWPDGFKVYPKLEKMLKRRSGALSEDGQVDWALAETLAFATILSDGRAVRLTGQDSERGTFAHRHLVLHDPETGKSFCPLHTLPQSKASFAIHNSPLSEASVLGFEYGYNVFEPETLVLWEAQFGDFANAAQVIIDQFLSAGRAKWAQRSSLVMLLPHGYEGQGPEHSSARLERFLQLAAENNCVIGNLTTAAQYFHILRRQASLTGKEDARPLILMTPKSLIRNKRSASKPAEFESGSFQPVIEEPLLGHQPKKVKRLVLASGKVAVDLQTELEGMEHKPDWLHVLRVEQLYPFPKEEIQARLGKLKNLREVVWLQEEPKNMGAWFYMEPRLRETVPSKVDVRYVGRPERSSTAVGQPDVHDIEQERILSEALNPETIKTDTIAGGKRHA